MLVSASVNRCTTFPLISGFAVPPMLHVFILAVSLVSGSRSMWSVCLKLHLSPSRGLSEFREKGAYWVGNAKSTPCPLLSSQQTVPRCFSSQFSSTTNSEFSCEESAWGERGYGRLQIPRKFSSPHVTTLLNNGLPNPYMIGGNPGFTLNQGNVKILKYRIIKSLKEGDTSPRSPMLREEYSKDAHIWATFYISTLNTCCYILPIPGGITKPQGLHKNS